MRLHSIDRKQLFDMIDDSFSRWENHISNNQYKNKKETLFGHG